MLSPRTKIELADQKMKAWMRDALNKGYSKEKVWEIISKAISKRWPEYNELLEHYHEMLEQLCYPQDSEELQEYVAFCPSCGQKLTFDTPFRYDNCEAVGGVCSCGKKWSVVFDLDKSGTFGVMSFQCDNEDRIQDNVNDLPENRQ